MLVFMGPYSRRLRVPIAGMNLGTGDRTCSLVGPGDRGVQVPGSMGRNFMIGLFCSGSIPLSGCPLICDRRRASDFF